MAGKKRRPGIQRPAFQDKRNGVEKSVLPQVWVKPWLRERLEIAVGKRAEAEGERPFSMAEYIREAVREKMDRDLGPEPASPAPRRI